MLQTEPAAGEMLRKGETLVIWVSLGNELAPVPADLVGKTLDEARVMLDEAGGFVATVANEPHDEEVPAGVVMAVAPETTGEQPKGSEVLLTVSAGPAPRSVPDGLAGGSYEDAAKALEAVQLQATKVEEFSDDVDKGKVIGTRPPAGEQLARGATVEVVVSKGPDVVKVPKVEGLSLDEAIERLEGAGLTVGDVSGPARGEPYVTDPPEGTTVKRGTTVDIYLRR